MQLHRRHHLLLLLLHLVFLLEPFSVKSEIPRAPALYVFGDSLSDAGNNNGLQTYAKADYFPYGVDFACGAAGRFTNGKTFADFTAEALGLPYAPAYLRLTYEERATIATGINYASGSAGILDETGRLLGENVPLRGQVENFRRTVEWDLPKIFQEHDLLHHLSTSIFFLSIGSNDYINNYLQPGYGSIEREPPPLFAQHLIDALQKNIERLYNLGARKFAIFDIGPLGCIPNNTNSQPIKGECVEEINNIILEFNYRLLPLVARLTSALPEFKAIQLQTYPISQDIYMNPSSYGFRYTNVPCCLTASGEGLGPCIPLEKPCPDRSKHMYMDAFHPTEANNVVVAKACLKYPPSPCFPMNMNIQQLAKL